jgi:hypothetical protein
MNLNRYLIKPYACFIKKLGKFDGAAAAAVPRLRARPKDRTNRRNPKEW